MIWIARLFWLPIVTAMALPWFVFCTFLDGTPRDWWEFMVERYADAWAGRVP